MLCQVGTYITWTITLIWSVADNYHLKTWESILFTCAESYNQILCELDKEDDGWTHALRPVISHAHRYTYITPHINRQDTPTNSIKDGWHTHEQSMNHISLNKKEASLGDMQSHPLCRMCFSQYQPLSTVLWWLGDGSCTCTTYYIYFWRQQKKQ